MESAMSIRRFQVNNFDRDHEVEKNPREKAVGGKDELSPEALERVKKANQYFDAHPPRARTQAELDDFLARF
jgi:hypothetical protein